MKSLIVLFCCSLVAFVADASQPSPEQNEAQRKLYRQLEAKIDSQPQALADHSDQLQGYPLLPYLQAAVLGQRLQRTSPEELASFISQHQPAPFAEQLRLQWLRSLKARKLDDAYLEHYQPTRDDSLRCHYLNLAGKRSASRSKALQEFHQWWLSGEDMPADCRPIEKLWQEFGGKTPELLWQRIEQAIRHGKPATALALKKDLPKIEQAAVDYWLQVRQNPGLVARPHKNNYPNELEYRIKAYGLERLAWRDRDVALNHYQQVATDEQFPNPLRVQVQKTYALALASAAHPAGTGFLAAIPQDARDERIDSWRIVDALRRLNWDDTDYWLSQLDAKTAEQARWRYFSGKSAAAQGRSGHASAVWQPLASESSYYGFLARAQIGLNGKPTAPALEVSAKTLAAMREHPSIRRAQELLALSRTIQARREWQAMLPTLQPSEAQAAAMIAHEWGWDDRAIFSLAKAPVEGAWDVRFPLQHRERIALETEKHALDPTWAFAITRQESAFMSDAKSPAGAMGLMQLMPATAQMTAKKHRISYRGQHDLIQPHQNIRLGVAHLADLIDRNEGNFVYATAAYNAGQGRVNRWREQFGELPLDIWIETIPYNETQQYVKNVMAYSLIYSGRLEQPTSAFDYLIGQIGAPATTVSPAINITP